MEATKVLVYYAGIGNKPYIGITLSNKRSYLETICLCYADNSLLLRKLSGQNVNGGRISAKEIIELMSGCFDKNSNLETEIAKFFGKSEHINSIMMNVYGISVLANRRKCNPLGLYVEWEMQHEQLD